MKEIIVGYDGQILKAAVLEDGQLMEFYEDEGPAVPLIGNIYRGRVENVLPGMQAAFVDIGLDKNAFLYVRDAFAPTIEESGDEIPGDLPPIEQILKPRQELLVQIVKEPTGNKGARVTTNLTIPGRYSVILPTVDYIGVSRKITDGSERKRLRDIARNAGVQGLGIIVRTLAQGISEAELIADIQAQAEQWERIRQKVPHISVPGLVHQEVSLVDRLLREIIDQEVDGLITDNADIAQTLRLALKNMGHRAAGQVRYDHRGNLFVQYGIYNELRKALKPKVWLRNGGYLVIQQTEALTVIDVNTGKYVGKNSLENTIIKTNLEAVKEIARQLRLRNIGGIIVIDFIDMANEDHRQAVLKALQESCQKDRIKCQVFGITQLGLVEMTRKKAGQPLRVRYTATCKHCEGMGHILKVEDE